MIARVALRLLRETRPKALGAFCLNFGLGGVGAVRRFRRRARRGEYFPAFLFVSVTDSCNLRCQGCWVAPGGAAREMEPEALDRIIVEGASRGSTTFGILGGEPLLYGPLLEVLARHPRCYFLLFTNGTLIDDGLAAEMARLGNVSPVISIEGRERVSDVRRGGSSVYERTMAGVDHCTRNRLITGVSTSICRSNLRELATEAFATELVERGVHYLWFSIYRPVGPQPCPELALSADEIVDLRRFMVDLRCRVPLLVVDSYWDHDGRALCPAAVGIGHHIGPAGHLEPCPPIQLALETVGDGADLADTVVGSVFLDSFRRLAAESTRGCILLERPDLLRRAAVDAGAHDSSGRGTVLAELEAMSPRTSHHLPGREIAEKEWSYRFAKKNWFFGFGAYG
jgi:MoaA/NifB/PqqE/SkfB family radical SAM enzyme